MAVVCAYRSTQTDLWYNQAKEGPTMAQIRNATVSAVATATTSAETNCFGGKYLDMANAGIARSPMWAGFENTPATPATSGFAMLARIIPRWTGTPAAVDVIMMGGSNPNVSGILNLSIQANGTLRFRYSDADGQTAVNLSTTGTYTSYTSGTAIDLMFSWDGTTAAGTVNFGINGTVFESRTATTALYSLPNQKTRTGIVVGNGPNAAISNFDLNEFVIFDNATTVATGVRTAFWTLAQTDLSVYTDPGTANVNSATSYTFAGVSETGSYVTPAATSVRSGIVFGNSVTGSYTVAGGGLAARGGWWKTIG